MSTIVVRDGEWEAEVDDLGPAIRRALDDAGRQMLDEVQEKTERIYADARRLWPVGRRDRRHSRDTLSRRVVLQGDEIVGEVRAGASYARYIRSAQISTSPPPTREDYAQQVHAAASIRDQPHPTDAEVRRRYQTFYGKTLGARAHARRIGKLNRKASRSGSAMWLLLRWPERHAADELEVSLGPLIEAELSGRLEG